MLLIVTHCPCVLLLLTQNASDTYVSSTSEQFEVAPVSPVPTTSVTLPALSLAADAEQLSCALARLLVRYAGDVAAAAAAATHGPRATPPLVDGVRQRQRRPVDRSASEPLSASSLAVVEAGAVCRYKTELCRPYEENGTCKYADKCQFAHGRAELRPVVRHPKYKTDLCKTYHTTGLCPYGPRCHFIHNDDERRLNELNRIAIERQKAALLIQKQAVVQAAMAALVRRHQLADAVASRSPSPQSSTMDDEPVSCGDETTWVAEPVPLGPRVHRSVPQITDAEVQAIVSRLLVAAADISHLNSNIGDHRPHHHVQLHPHHQRH